MKYHEKKEDKLRDYDHFTSGVHTLYKDTRCFYVVRKDGTKEDFSYTKCL